MFDRCRLLKTVLLNKKNHLEIVYGTKPITCMIPIFTLCNTPPPPFCPAKSYYSNKYDFFIIDSFYFTINLIDKYILVSWLKNPVMNYFSTYLHKTIVTMRIWTNSQIMYDQYGHDVPQNIFIGVMEFVICPFQRNKKKIYLIYDHFIHTLTHEFLTQKWLKDDLLRHWYMYMYTTYHTLLQLYGVF